MKPEEIFMFSAFVVHALLTIIGWYIEVKKK